MAGTSSPSRPSAGSRSARWRSASKSIAQEDERRVPIGRATLRTLAYLASALPLGAGFLPGVISADRLALHDRLAHTRVVRPLVDLVDQPMRRLAVFICSFGYIGFFPFAPGTVGSAAGVAVYLAARTLARPVSRAAAHCGAVCRPASSLTRPCEEDLRCIDPGPIVIDEVMGMLITLFMIPVGWGGCCSDFCCFARSMSSSRFRRVSSNGCTAAWA